MSSQAGYTPIPLNRIPKANAMLPMSHTQAGAFHAARNRRASKRVRMDMNAMLPSRNKSESCVIITYFLNC